MILVDTSVWIDHLRSPNAALSKELAAENVLAHSFVIGELACGSIKNRREVLGLLSELPLAPGLSHIEALAFLEARSLMARGIGFIDVHILASTALVPTARLWTRDRRLAAAAADLGLAHEPAKH